MTEPKEYGVYVLYCPCGWQTLGKPGYLRGNRITKPEKCAACGAPSEGELTLDTPAGLLLKPHIQFTDQVAGSVATLASLREERLVEHVMSHGLLVHQISKNRFVVLKLDAIMVVVFGDGQARSFRKPEVLCGPCDYEAAMAYLRLNTPPLPDYLK